MQNLAQQLSNAVNNADIGKSVLDLLLPDDVPHAFETFFFDYKQKLPASLRSGSNDEKAHSKAELCEIIKDCLAFHNTYGGYIVFGVSNKGESRVVGTDVDFDVGDFGNRFAAYTGHSVEFLYKSFSIENNRSIGLLYIPKRFEEIDPVSFRKSAAAYPNSSERAFQVGETYIRFRDACRPATANSDDWKLLHGKRIWIDSQNSSSQRLTQRNVSVSIPPRDTELVDFVGRQDYLTKLREWLLDKRSPVRLLTGIGGLGKTSVAYQLCEEIIDLDFQYLESVIWLTAKERTYSSVKGKIVETNRTDFTTPRSLYNIILDRLGALPHFEDDEDDYSYADYEEAITNAFEFYKVLIIIDDIDSLSIEDQREVIFRLSNCVNRTVDGKSHPCRILFTSRTDQSLPPANVIKVFGFPIAEFEIYVNKVCVALSVKKIERNQLVELHSATSGSPLFASSLLRLVRLGTPLRTAISQWKGEDGSEVRKFAFERELKDLTSGAARTLYAICLLNQTSITELTNVLDTTDRIVRDFLAQLQSFHLLVLQNESAFDSVLSAPAEIILTKDVLRRHLESFATQVELSCSRVRETEGKHSKTIAFKIGVVTRLWRNESYENALSESLALLEKFKENCDVQCLVGVSYLKPIVTNHKLADRHFSEAKRLGCKRPELLDGWITSKEEIRDWTGLLQITKGVRSHPVTYDRTFSAYIRAIDNLIDAATYRNDGTRLRQLCEEGLESIDKKISSPTFNRNQANDLIFYQRKFAGMLFNRALIAVNRPGDNLNVFDAGWKTFVFQVRLAEHAEKAAHSLVLWWRDVLSRPELDYSALDILRLRLERLEKIQTYWSEGAPALAEKLLKVRLRLAHEAASRSN